MQSMEDTNMKKTYEAPTATKIAFNYRDQVVAASGANPISDDPITGRTVVFNGCDLQNFYLFVDVCSVIRG